MAHPPIDGPQGDMIDDLPDGVLALDHALRAVGVNARACELLRRGRRSLVGRDLRGAWPEVEARELEHLCQRARSTGRVATDASLRLTLDGARRPAAATAAPRPDGGVLLVIRDQTGAEALREREGFERRLAFLESVAGGLAHEIRNPLGGIRGAAQLLGRGPDPGERDALVGLIRDEVDRIEARVRALMDFTRPAPPARQPVSLNRLLDEEARLLRAEMPGLALVLDLDPSLPDVEGDGDRLREVVRNLLRNAGEATRARGRVEATTRAGAVDRVSDARGDRGVEVRLVVADDGPGVPGHAAPRIFDPFFSLKPDGSGLGLSVARKSVEEHGGALDLLAPGGGEGLGGAVFALRLRERLPGARGGRGGAGEAGAIPEAAP